MENLLLKIILGGILGFCGQSLRVIVGLKGLNEEVSERLQQYDTLDRKSVFNEMFDTKRLLISLLIGFVAGVLASLTIDGDIIATPLPKAGNIVSSNESSIWGIIAAGYAGTDFIEKFLGKLF